MTDNLTIVLVHGAYADAGSWRHVVTKLLDRHFSVTGPQLPLVSLAEDAGVVRHTLLRAGDGPKLVVAHSYGGAVISEADYEGTGVAGLVYIAAYAPDTGESVLSLNGTVAPLDSAGPDATLVDSEAQQLTLAPDAYVRYFAPDLAPDEAHALAVLQRPVGFGAGGAPATRAAWRDLPTSYQISLDDQIIAPELQRMFMARMPHLTGTLELRSSHASLLAHPGPVADFIAAAAERVRRAPV
jgi:hypothetical protein